VPAVFGGDRRWLRPLATRPLVWCGAISYGFYLWHVQIIEAVLDWTDTAKFTGAF
jgi:peptidoglycan/LPS O-acetylase OafA/YrhL